MAKLSTYATATPVLTDYASGIDDPGGTPSVKNFTFSAVRDLLQANLGNVTITGGSITGITDLAVADGGTGASTASGARTNLGLGSAAVENIGTSGSNVPKLDGANTWGATQLILDTGGERLQLYESTTATAFDAIHVRNNADATDIVFRHTPSLQLRSEVGGAGTLIAEFGSSGGFVVGAPTGGNQGAGTVNATGLYDDGNLAYSAGGVDVAVADGGTGASTASGARTNLGAVNIAGDTMTGDLTLPNDPTNALHAATKQYVDAAGGGPTHVRKTADETVNNSSTLQNDDELAYALAANEIVEFRARVIVSSNATADFKHAFTVPTGAVLSWNSASGGNEVSGSGTPQTVGIFDTAAKVFVINGIVVNGANTGNLQYQWAQGTADASDTSVELNSVLTVWTL